MAAEAVAAWLTENGIADLPVPLIAELKVKGRYSRILKPEG
jgi:hypothetical protein